MRTRALGGDEEYSDSICLHASDDSAYIDPRTSSIEWVGHRACFVGLSVDDRILGLVLALNCIMCAKSRRQLIS